MKKKKPTIAELEKILNEEGERPISIRPDGSIWVDRRRKNIKPITMHNDLGGEYGTTSDLSRRRF